MDAAVPVMLSLWLLIAAAIRGGLSDDSETDKKTCSGLHVCTTLMRYPDGYTADEGPNCKCRADQLPCTPETWEEDNPDHTLTWQHYERSHWMVQYKFCGPVFAKRPECNIHENERAAVITTDVKLWQPDLAEPRCRCPGNVFQLMGWKREGTQWKYYYECHKPECAIGLVNTRPARDNGRLPCAKIYVDQYKATDKVMEVQFLCACPEGQMCPGKLSKKQEDQDEDMETDLQGSFVYKYCESTKVSRPS